MSATWKDPPDGREFVPPGDGRGPVRLVARGQRPASEDERHSAAGAALPGEAREGRRSGVGMSNEGEAAAAPNALVAAGPVRRPPMVVDAAALDGRTVRVRPDVFAALVGRMADPVVVHLKRRFGQHAYVAQCGGFTVETHSPRELPLDAADGLGGAASAYEADLPATASRAGSLGRMLARRGKRGEKKPPLVEFYTAEHYYVTEWWNTPEDPALSVARIRVEPGVRTRSYRLRGITERYLFLSGHGLVEIDGKSREVGPGDGLLIKGGSWRSITNTGDRDLGLLAICRPRFRRLSHEHESRKRRSS